MLVEINGVSKRYRSQQVLQDIRMNIREKEIFGLIGPSGAGKTTLVRLIIGAVRANAGEIRLGNCRVPDIRAMRLFGYMPQSDALYSDLSGWDNLKFFGGMYGLAGGGLRRRGAELLRLVELEADAGKRVGDYSGGMRKRLSLAVALLHDPQLLVLDEPTVGIDPVLRRKIWDEFARLRRQGKTLLITTHVMDEAVKCDRLALIRDGRVIACDTVPALLERTREHSIEALFFEKEAEA